MLERGGQTGIKIMGIKHKQMKLIQFPFTLCSGLSTISSEFHSFVEVI
jgi:hypothetical protein